MKLLIPLIVGLLGTPLVNGNSGFKKRVFARDQKYQDAPEASVLSFAKGMYSTLIKIALGYLCLVKFRHYEKATKFEKIAHLF